MTFILTMLLACGEKETAETAEPKETTEEVTEETGAAEEAPVEETGAE